MTQRLCAPFVTKVTMSQDESFMQILTFQLYFFSVIIKKKVET